jgi:hypothetical protein
MAKTIKEVYTDLGGNRTIEYFDDTTSTYNIANTVVATDTNVTVGGVVPTDGQKTAFKDAFGVVGYRVDGGTGLVTLSAAGADLPTIGPAYTFAGLPAASSVAAKSVRITNIGPTGAGSLWISDGSEWKPLNGTVLHCKNSGTLAAPLATVSAASKFSLPASDRVVNGSILIPIGTPRVGQGIRVSAKFNHRGTGGTWQVAARIGSGDTSSDPSFASFSGTAVDSQGVWLLQDMVVSSATTFISSTYAMPNSSAPGSMVLRNVGFNNAAQLYISFYAVSVNAADFIDLLSYRIEMID